MECDETKSKVRPEHPCEKANPFSVLTFSWVLPIFWKGRMKEMGEDDLFEVLQEHKASQLADKFERLWFQELDRLRIFNIQPDLKRVIRRIFGWKLLFYGLFAFLVEIVLSIAQPLLLGGLLDYFSSKQQSSSDGYLYAAGIVLCSAASILTHCYTMGLMHIGMKVRIALSSLIYRKALMLSQGNLIKVTVGHLVNLLSNDVNRFDFCFCYLHMLWIGPLETIIVTYFVWKLIGPASLIGLLSLLILIPFQAWLGRKVSMLRLKSAARTDERVRLMNEIIRGIQVIKMYIWEKPFSFIVSQARRKEINVITKSSYCKGIMLSFLMFHSRTSIFLSLLAYVLFGNAVITAQKVFVVTCFYNSLRQTMTIFFPFGMAYIAECFVSMKRIQDFLVSDEIENKFIIKPQVPIIHVGEGKIRRPVIALNSVSAKWTEELVDCTLNNVNVNIFPRMITSIIGPVAAGKSSMLHVILKELPVSGGSLMVNGSISYASQEPWLFAGSVRQNILFGEPFDKERYKNVISACALTTDLEQMPYGDRTLIGERGISLSGGQRARVNLARAIYKQADIYLLDDPLSAVDAHVGKHLFEDCIKEFLKGKTVVLITHQLQYLNYVDHIILIENGQISTEGKFSELLNKGLDFTKLLIGNENEGTNAISRKYSAVSMASSVGGDIVDMEIPDNIETTTKGSVKNQVYYTYLRSGGGLLCLLVPVLFFILAQAFATCADFWTSSWVNLEEYGLAPLGFINTRAGCIYVFAGLIIGTIIFTILRSFLFFYVCMRASKVLHDNMFDCVIRATMRFFHTNSSGRILNRFSSDMGIVDELLPSSFADLLQVSVSIVGFIVVVVVVNPWLLIPTFVSAMIFYYLRIVYLNTSRSVKRVEGVTRSPILSHLTASLQGLTTIRAYKAQKVLLREFESHQDLHSTAWYLYLATNRAFAFWLDFLCLIYVAFVTFNFLIVIPGSHSGAVGLAITQAIGLMGQFQYAMRTSAELESQMTSVERVLEYTQLYSEPPLESPPGKKPSATWPEKGQITFSEVSLRYSPHDTWILKDISFVIKPQEKIGIVGRTGAGKSSLIAALFRLTETEGKILLDGIESKSIGLHDLRSKISIIPQEPVLFSGSLRKNLDRFDQFPDELLWSALEQVELKEGISELAGGLNAKMAEGGTNFSVGQRQLICLARAIVRNNKIIVLDEATANVDPKTDALIQKTLRQKFSSCTVLTIAHRLVTVMHSDKILVIDNGIMMEFDHPHILLENRNSFLSKLVQQSNKSNVEMIRNIAAESYQNTINLHKAE